ncbi:MAG: RNA polymerase sigma factor [Oscillospiraceae bacterium]|nr:RNA polymerase sigma factor [Oscillospiraceae bacterium]
MLIYLQLIPSEDGRSKFERLYDTYRQTMYYAAFRILRHERDAEDAVHEAFLRVAVNLEKINEEDCHKTRAFLVIITRNAAIDIYRRNKRERAGSYEELEPYIADGRAPEAGAELTEALAKLPPDYSAVLLLKYAQGYSDGEIAEILGIKPDNMRKRISRAKTRLGEILGEEDDEA